MFKVGLSLPPFKENKPRKRSKVNENSFSWTGSERVPASVQEGHLLCEKPGFGNRGDIFFPSGDHKKHP